MDLDAKEEADSGETVIIDNLTLINLFLRFSGPISEARATIALLSIQVSGPRADSMGFYEINRLTEQKLSTFEQLFLTWDFVNRDSLGQLLVQNVG